MRRLVLAALVAWLALAPLALGALPIGRVGQGLVVVASLAGAVGVWRAPGLALSVAAVGLTLTLADLGARAFLDRVHYRPEDRHLRLWRVAPEGTRYDARVEERWDTVGDLAALSGGALPVEPREVRFRTDRWGYRNDEGGPVRVVLLGDSFGAGVGTTQDETLATRLAADHDLPTVNLSVTGQSPYDEAVTLASQLGRLDLAPDAILVWLLFAGNDLDGVCLDSLPGPPSVWGRFRAGVSTFRTRSVLRQLIQRVRQEPTPVDRVRLPDGSTMALHKPYVRAAEESVAMAQAKASVACVGGTMDRVAALASSAGLRLLVAVAPTKAEVYGPLLGLGPFPGGPRLVLRGLAAEHDLPVLDLTPALAAAARQGLGDGRLVWWRDDTHWNGAGHAVVARVLAEAIRTARP